MNFPSLDDFRQLRRILPLTAGILFVVAIALPIWEIVITAPQYPGVKLPAGLYAYPKLTGRIYELKTLNHYVGFYFPDPVYWQPNYEVHKQAINVPEWILGPFVLAFVGIVSVIVSALPTNRIQRGLKWGTILITAIFVIGLAEIQYRLYQAGHSLAPDAEINAQPFTIPIWGPYDVANLHAFASFAIGGQLLILGTIFLFIAYYFRDSRAEIWDVPDLVSGTIDRVRR